MTTQEIIEVIKGLSVLELNDLVKACEEEFGESYLDLVNTIKYMSRMMVSIFLIQPFRKVK